MQQSVARIQPQFSGEELDIIRRTVASKTSKDQFALFIQVCKYSGLNPFARQIYAVVRGGEMVVQTGIDGYRILAERSGKYAGQIGPQWCGEDEVWKDVWLSSKPPAAARIGVIRRDFEQPVWGVAKFTSYEQSSSPLWRKMPEVLLAKCAESLALRKAFPSEMAGIYTTEEMTQADHSEEMLPSTTIEQAEGSGEVVDAQVEQETTPPPTSKQLYAKGKQKGLWQNVKGYCAFASAELGIVVANDTPLNVEQRIQMNNAIEEEQPIAQVAKAS